MSWETAKKTSHVFKVTESLELTLDVISNETNPQTAVIHYHGGYVVLGHKDSWSPVWLIETALRRGWAYVSPSYRLLPEASGKDVLDDALDAAKWVIENLTPRIIIAGSSGGGYLSVATAAQLDSPRPLAVLSVYGMLDFAIPPYTTLGSTSGQAPPLPDCDVVEQRILELRGKPPIISHEPIDFLTDERVVLIRGIHQAALYPDLLTGELGLSAKISEHGLKAIHPSDHRFFPVAFGLTKDFPPTALLHGLADDSVFPCEGKGHGFDLGDIPPGTDVEAKETASTPVIDSIRRIINFLDKAAASK
ncbi:carboxylesterase M8 like protein [Verticillium longisporum]|nr:carboxylesterase M8 like protein [Verticillium longisporum]